MTGSNFKYFVQWLKNNNLKLQRCNCGCYGGEHDASCAQVTSEENLYDQWQAEVSKKGKIN